MSRIGKKPVPVPSNVQIEVKSSLLKAKGPLGEETLNIEKGIIVEQENNFLNVKIDETLNNPELPALHGLSRSLISNLVIGVSTGFERDLEIIGVGYRATQKGQNITFQLGYSHNIDFEAPKGITLVVVDQNNVKVKGSNKELVGQVAANIRKLRSPEPYKGKGIRYKGEVVRKKAGKTGKK